MKNPVVKMKRLIFLALLVVVLGFSTIAQADLVNNGGGLIYDTDLDITWYDAPPVMMNWETAMDWATSLTLGGVTGWRLPTTPGTFIGYTDEGEMGHLFSVEFPLYVTLPFPHGTPIIVGSFFTNLQDARYWTSTEYVTTSGIYAWRYSLGIGYQHFESKSLGTPPFQIDEIYALAVHSGNVGAPIPEPATMLLLGFGLVGLAGARRSMKK